MAIKGIDVSNHQGDINWRKVAGDGVSFAIIRAGYGRTNVDEHFVSNIEGACNAGLKVGVYWFSYALNENHALQEAKKCISLIQKYKITLPVFYDFEYDTVRYARNNGVILGKNEFNRFAKIFCDYVQSQGYKAGIYYNLDYKRHWIEPSVCGKYCQWLAWYTSEQDKSYDMQQYTSQGYVAGISGSVDMNWLFNEALLRETPLSGSPSYHQVQKNKRVECVKQLQTALNHSYGLALAVDGSAGPLTKAAIRRHYLYYKKLTIRNEHVRWLQKTLSDLKYPLEGDGSFGPDCERKVTSFQKDYQLQIDGYAGVETHMKLISLQ